MLSAPGANGLRTLLLDRPDKANALSSDLVEAMHARLDEIGTETRALLIRGQGKNFCGGFDFAGHEQQSEGDLLLRFVRINELLARLRRAPFLTIAWVSGAAFGAGADIACACALRLGAANARFRFPGFQFGIALGTRRLAAIVGPDRARAILLHNAEVGATDALAYRLLTELTDEERLPGRIDELLHSTRKVSGVALMTLNALTDADAADADLADLVRSAARPGLHARIAAYRGEVKPPPAP